MTLTEILLGALGGFADSCLISGGTRRGGTAAAS
jgi:hypothetical protein